MPANNVLQLPPVNPTGAAAQSGVENRNLYQQTTLQRKIDEISRKLNDRLGNITSISQTAQQGAFNAFGNNFVTRGAMQAGGAVKDVFDTLTDFRTEEEKAKDDPVLAQALLLKEAKHHSGLLEDIKEATRVSADFLMDMIDKDKSEDIVKGLNELAVLFEKPKDAPIPEQKEKATKIKVDDILDPIEETEELDRKVKDTVNVKSRVVPDKPTAEQKRAKNKEEIIDVDAVEVKRESVDPNMLRLGNSVDEKTLDVVSEKKDTAEDVEEKKTSKQVVLLLASINKNMEKFVAGPMSTQEADLEAANKKPAVLALDAPKNLKAEQPVEENKDSGWWDNLLGLGGLRAAFGLLTKGLGNLWKAIAGVSSMVWGLLKGAGGLGGKAFDMLKSGADIFGKGLERTKDIAKTAGGKAIDIAKSGAEKAGDLLGKGKEIAKSGADDLLTAGKGLAKGSLGKIAKFGKLMSPAIIASAVGAGIDGLAGQFGVGKDENGEDIQIDTKQDDSNWDRMNPLQKLESGLSRGLEHGADFMFMGNIANAARDKRIKSETEFFKKQEQEALDKSLIDGVKSGKTKLDPDMIRDGAKMFEQNRVGTIDENDREIERLKKKAESAKEQSNRESMTQIVNSNVTNNSVFMPSRKYARNTDMSFNSYLKAAF